MRTRMLLGAAAATALLTAAPLSAATAGTTHDVLTTGHVGGANVAVGATIQSGLAPGTQATFYAPGTTVGVSCARALVTSTVSTNPAAPGTADESLSAQTIGQCTSSIPEVTVMHIRVLGLPYTVTVSDAPGDPVTVANASTRITFNTPAGIVHCTYSDPAVDGNASNTGSTITFTNQMFTLIAGPSSVCPPAGDFSATLGPNRDTSVSGNPRVYVN